MKLKNKQTGIVGELHYEPDKEYHFTVATEDPADMAIYRSLTELNADWEDVAPKEPLIKDEKIRKAVRAWAEADDLDNFRVQNEHFNECKIIGYTAGINKASFIGFQTTIAHADNKKQYTIDELCGEEEE